MEAQRQRFPKSVGPWLFLAGIAQQQGKSEAVLPLLDEGERQTGKRVEWYLARARYWAQVGGKSAPDQLRKLEQAQGEFPAADGNRLLRTLADAFESVGDPAAAESLTRQLAKRQPNDLAMQLRLFERELAPGRTADLEKTLAEIRRIEGDGGPATAYAQAALLVLEGRAGDTTRAAEAHALLAKAAELRPNWSRVPLLEAELFEQQKRKDRALEKYQAALDRGEGRLTVVRRILQLLYEQNRYAEAQALIRKVPEHALAVRDLGQMAAALSIVGPGGQDTEARDKALELARKAAAKDPPDYRDQLWLGQVAATVGKADEAEAAFRKARQLADTEPSTWVALILFLAPRDAGKAEAELKAASAKLTKDQMPLVRAAAYEALGRLKEAEEQVLAATTAKPGDPMAVSRVARFYLRTRQTATAEPWLRKLIEPKLGAPETAVTWARRELALLLASRRSYPLFLEALALLDANRTKAGETPENSLVRCQVLASQPARRREAINLLQNQKTPTHGSASSPLGTFLLAQLHEADGNWPRARTLMSDLLTEHGNDPSFVAYFARGLLRHQEAESAATWVAKLAELAPKAFETTELRARVLKEQGKLPEATELVKTYACEKDARIELAAPLLEQLGLADEAEAMYRTLAAAGKRPEGALLLAQFLSRKKLPEALDLCEKAWQTCRPDLVAFTSVAALRLGRANEEQCRRVASWFTAAIDKNAKDPIAPLLMAAHAELQMLRGQYDDAVRLYRTVLSRRPKDPVPLNNLAYLLACKEGKVAEALDFANRAIDFAGPTAEMLDTRAVVYLKAGKAELALEDLQSALAQSPTPTMYFHLAEAHYRAKNRTAAVAALQKAVDGGLRVENVQALERTVFQQLRTELNVQ
jgi:tetratricopeptide (TPR) repeat protein